MVCAGIGATSISIGPVLLGYDRDFLQAGVSDLNEMNERLVPFLQHDRITMAGCMTTIGCNDLGFAFAMRRGWRWARTGFIAAGSVGFPTFFLFLSYRFFDPLHFAVAVGFFPLYLGGVFGRRSPRTWHARLDTTHAVRTRAAVAQLLMVMLSVGVALSGFIIMSVGIRDVLIPSDRAYLRGSQQMFEAALDGRLLRFVAHDRAGFGGALASLGVGMTCMSLWGWRRGVRSTWWSSAAASIVGFGAALGVHLAVGYTDVLHLLPVYLGIPMVGVALAMGREWLAPC
jgi:hypothetical protein